MSEQHKVYGKSQASYSTVDKDHIRKYHYPHKRRKNLHFSKTDISKSNDFDIPKIYNSNILSKQSQDPVGVPVAVSVLSNFQIALIVLSCALIICLLGLVLFKKKEKGRNIPSILLESRPVMPQMTQMQEELRDSFDSTRSEIPPPYILPPSLEIDNILQKSSLSYKTKLAKPLSTLTVDSQESLGRFYRS